MKIISCLLLIFCIGFYSNVFAQENRQNKVGENLGNPSFTNLNINNISTFFYNNGISDYSPEGNSGFYFPKGSNKTAVFSSGFLWGALVPGDPQPRVGGSSYRSGLQGGKIVSTMVAEDPNANHVRIYRVRRDVYPGGPLTDLSSEINDEGKTEQEIRDQYEKDWLEWRAIDGAPFEDKNANGIYEPTIDIPGVVNADQTIWYVANDLDAQRTTFLYGANPLGLELQVTIWGYNNDEFLNNVLFRKYMMINKSGTTFTDVYISLWADVDLGYAGDDLAGCDTTLNLGYVYNSQERDDVYYPGSPPALGFSLLKGAEISGSYDLPMTAHYFFWGGSQDWGDPPLGDQDGSTEFYNFMRGRNPHTGEPFINPITGNQTSFALSGDPLTNNGWLDSFGGDRRNGIASGPFQMAVGDTQEIVIAEIAALGLDRLDSFRKLKNFTALTKSFYDSGMSNVFLNKTPTPKAEVKSTISQIKIDWSLNSTLSDAIENFNKNGYKFQGYNVYQYPEGSVLKETSIKVATFDIIDGVTGIQGIVIDPNTGLPIQGLLQNGTDSGIYRFFATDFDYINNEHMIIGKKYYFGVTAYTYNSDPLSYPRSTESNENIIQAIYYDNYPGAAYGDNISVKHTAGEGDAEISVDVADPTKLTGDKYEVYFSERQEIRNQNGDWVPASIVNKVNSPNDLTGSSISVSAIYADTTSLGIELNFKLDLVSSNGAYADGIQIIFPSNVTIINVPQFYASGEYINPEIIGNVVNLGLVNNQQTQNGIFQGGEIWKIYISQFNPPILINWIVVDDGFGIPAVNAEGSTIINSIGFLTRDAKYWNVKNVTKDSLVLSNQSIVDGYYQFPPRDLELNKRYIYYDSPVTDGLQVTVNKAVYETSINFASLSLSPSNSPTKLSSNSSSTNLDIQNYTIFGGTVSSKAIDIYGFGTNDPELLQQDYEIRFTGVWDSTIVNSQKIFFIKSGGQMATIFAGPTANSLATHPLNPNPGLNNPFLLRIPFEVWNKNTGMQVNLIFRDRIQTTTADPFFSWNPKNRMYAVIVNSPYDANTIITASHSDTKNALATWVLVFYGTNYTLGDVVTIQYANQIKFGVDKFSFTAPRGVIEEKLTSYKIYNNYPNPFNPATKIRFFLPEAGFVKVEVFDILGQRVAILANKEFQSGIHELDFNGSVFASGMYIYTLEVKDRFFEAKKMLLLK